MYHTKILIVIITVIIINLCSGQNLNKKDTFIDYKKALVSYHDFEVLVNEVKAIRANNLISFDQLIAFQKEGNTIILDTRSKEKYEGKHLKSAINLPFTEFTQSNLKKILPDTSTRIIIYCNNNFEGSQLFFASKVYTPDMLGEKMLVENKKSIMLPLNIPTYINLYGYGYRNIFELNELVNVNDSRVEFEGDNGLKILQLKINHVENK